MAGPLKAHNWHDSFAGAEPVPPGPVMQPAPVKTINPSDPKNGPRKASSRFNDTYCE